MTTTRPDIDTWHRQLCPLTQQLIISGDLAEDTDLAVTQLVQWQQAGITHILDAREEWTDQQLVAKHAPDISYGWYGTHDNGTAQSDKWFTDGVAFATETLKTPDTVLLVHCHMGINRGPSMAYRILLEQGWNPIEALNTIKNTRPIARIRYAIDALNHYDRAHNTPMSQRVQREAQVEERVHAHLLSRRFW